MSLHTTQHAAQRIAPEVFEQAKRNAIELRRAAMQKLVDDLWRVMTAPLSSASPHVSVAATPQAPVAANANRPDPAYRDCAS